MKKIQSNSLKMNERMNMRSSVIKRRTSKYLSII